MSADLERLWTIDDCAAFLKVEASKVKYWIRCAYLPTIRLGRQIRLDPLDVREWVNGRKFAPRGEVKLGRIR